ncbi:MAG: immunoglobulin domain-containing protein [Planctomycetes bacterium]|nr:immunoglobulin domain-containing protein [Planctomycetota bacterium]
MLLPRLLKNLVMMVIMGIYASGSLIAATAPTVTTTAISGTTTTSANSGGNVTSDGGAAVTARGICWATSTPTIANSSTSEGTGTGTFTSTMTGLTPGTMYYVRAYATNSVGTSYGATLSVRAYQVPTITTQPASQSKIVGQTAIFTVAATGTPSPTYQWRKNGTNISGATATSYTTPTLVIGDNSALYSVVATNAAGATTSSDATLTVTIGPPALTTTAISGTTTTSANSGGNVTSDSGAAVTARGVCWATTATPTTANNTTSNGTGTGSFTSAITGLTPGTLYYVRSYATNSEGTSYGSQVSFTAHIAPSITTQPVNQSKIVGQTATFSVVASGTPNPTYQWRKDGVNISGATSSTYNRSSVQIGDNGAVFTVVVTNSAGSVTSGGATLSVAIGAPVLTTTAITGITTTSANSGGNVTSDSGAVVTARGVCWATTTNPTTADAITTNGTGTGTFTSALTGLTPGTLYYVRAYATNSVGTSYGAQVSFTAHKVPTITTQPANQSKVVGQTATFTVVASATPSPTYQWRKDAVNISGATSATYNKTNVQIGDNSAIFSVVVTNSAGTATSDGATLTVTPSIPTVSTTAISGITTTSAASGGNVTLDGGAAITARGVCWSTTTNPTTANNATSDGTGTGTYTSTMTGLTPGTTYYVRAYATNSAGTDYGSQISFKAYQVPTITTQPASQSKIVGQTATFSVTANGTPTPTYQWRKNGTNISGATATSYTTPALVIGDHSALYSVVVTNAAGATPSSDATLTVTIGPPVLTTTAISGITPTSASSGGNITSDSGAAVTARGVCWATSSNPTIANNTTSDGIGTGLFTSGLTNLNPGSTYFVRAYATNSVGTAYGSQISFTAYKVPSFINQPTNQSKTVGNTATFTGAALGTPNPTFQWRKNGINISGATTNTYTTPTLVLGDNGALYSVVVSNAAGTVTSANGMLSVTIGPPVVASVGFYGNTDTTASSGGNITSDGGAAVTARGVCWATTANPTTTNNTTSDGTGIGTFTSEITALTPGATYHVRAYATNSEGTSYSSGFSFVAHIAPSITSQPANQSMTIGQTATFSVGASGMPYPTYQWRKDGVNISGATNATYTKTNVQVSDSGVFTVVVTNSVGSVTSNAASLSVASGPPVLSTTAISGTTTTSATSGGNVTSDGGHSVTARGVCWATTTNPTTANNLTSDGTGTGTFTSAITGLTPGTEYHVRAYATNSQGTSYGSQVSFTAYSVPSITVQPVSQSTFVTDSVTFSVWTTGVPSRSFQWRKDGVDIVGATSGTYTRSNVQISDHGAVFSVFVYNSAGNVTSDGATLTVTIGPPVVETLLAVSSITTTSAYSGGYVISERGAPVTARGVCWSTMANPTTADSKTVDGTGAGDYASMLTGLTTSTTYQVRAYATNSAGTGYGPSVSFTTPGPTFRSPLIKPPPFDAAAWQNDAAYRSAYVLNNDPGRVWQTAAGSVGTPALEILGQSQVTVTRGGITTLRVRGAPGSPVTFVLLGSGYFAGTEVKVCTVLADANGDAEAPYSATFAGGGGGRIPILVGSPMSVGQVRFLLETP